MSKNPTDPVENNHTEEKTATSSRQDGINLEKELEETQRELKVQQEKVEEYKKEFLLAKAEVENVRRRAALDVENAHKYGSEKFARELLNVVDSLEKGLESAPADDKAIQPIREGLVLTHKLLLDTMDKFGIKMINPEGETFDPKYHEALSMQESSDVEPNCILTVIQCGFLQYDRVLRPARVIVARAQSTPKIDEKA